MIMIEKVLEISLRLGLKNSTITYKWIDKFKKRHNSTYKLFCKKSASNDPKTAKEQKENMLLSLENYALKMLLTLMKLALFSLLLIKF